MTDHIITAKQVHTAQTLTKIASMENDLVFMRGAALFSSHHPERGVKLEVAINALRDLFQSIYPQPTCIEPFRGLEPLKDK